MARVDIVTLLNISRRAAIIDTRGQHVFSCSHSFHWFVYDLLPELAAAAGISGHVSAGISRIGGSTITQHWDVAADANLCKQSLEQGTIDVLMLAPIWLPDEGIAQFARLAVKKNPDVRITVQEFWLPNDEFEPVYPLQVTKKVDHNAATIAALTRQQDLYDAGMDELIRTLNRELGREALKAVPSGRAVIALREKIIAAKAPGVATQEELFEDSWGHPALPIQVLAAYCHFAVIYGRSPVGLPIPKVLAEAKNEAWRNPKLNQLLQTLAWEAVVAHPLTGVKR